MQLKSFWWFYFAAFVRDTNVCRLACKSIWMGLINVPYEQRLSMPLYFVEFDLFFCRITYIQHTYFIISFNYEWISTFFFNFSFRNEGNVYQNYFTPQGNWYWWQVWRARILCVVNYIKIRCYFIWVHLSKQFTNFSRKILMKFH